MRKIILAGLVAVVAVTAIAVPAQAATPKERALARQVKTLKAQAAKLKRERNAARTQLTAVQAGLAATQASLATVTAERDAARGQVSTVSGERDAARASLAVCQQGVVPAVSTMTPMQLSTNVLPTLHAVFEGWTDGYGAGQYSAYASKSSTVSDLYRDQRFSFDVTEWLQ
jgi:outer membrane murein-binding lipoprotein Lpp